LGAGLIRRLRKRGGGLISARAAVPFSASEMIGPHLMPISNQIPEVLRKYLLKYSFGA
jgi:hypothetical protein